MTREEIVEVMATALLNWTEPNGLPRLWGSEHSEHQARAALAALEARGMMIRPREPDEAMCLSGEAAAQNVECAAGLYECAVIYRAMITSRPR